MHLKTKQIKVQISDKSEFDTSGFQTFTVPQALIQKFSECDFHNLRRLEQHLYGTGSWDLDLTHFA